jgi:hypothetical protein
MNGCEYNTKCSINLTQGLGLYLQHLIFFINYGFSKLVLYYTRLERHDIGKHSGLFSSFVSFEENEGL